MSNPSSTLLPLLPPFAAVSPPPPPPSYTTYILTDFGFGYALAIALGFLLLLSALLLSSYICCRRYLLHRPPSAGFILPRVIFVTEDDEENRPASVVGLDESIINSYPKFPYFKSSSNNSAASDGESASGTCSICLCDYREGEMLRMMPDCNHSFHVLCLDAWLCLSGSCPVCRSSPLPTPLSTPLAEVVPLALFPDNRHRRP